MFMEQKRTLSLLVDNTPGLLSRVAGLFSRRGYNIETITAGVTADPRYTRMTVVLYCSDEMILEQIKKQLAKLVDVRDIKELKPDEMKMNAAMSSPSPMSSVEESWMWDRKA